MAAAGEKAEGSLHTDRKATLSLSDSTRTRDRAGWDRRQEKFPSYRSLRLRELEGKRENVLISFHPH